MFIPTPSLQVWPIALSNVKYRQWTEWRRQHKARSKSNQKISYIEDRNLEHLSLVIAKHTWHIQEKSTKNRKSYQKHSNILSLYLLTPKNDLCTVAKSTKYLNSFRKKATRDFHHHHVMHPSLEDDTSSSWMNHHIFSLLLHTTFLAVVCFLTTSPLIASTRHLCFCRSFSLLLSVLLFSKGRMSSSDSLSV